MQNDFWAEAAQYTVLSLTLPRARDAICSLFPIAYCNDSKLRPKAGGVPRPRYAEEHYGEGPELVVQFGE